MKEDEGARGVAHHAQALLPRERRRRRGRRAILPAEESKPARSIRFVREEPILETSARHERVDQAVAALIEAEGQ